MFFFSFFIRLITKEQTLSAIYIQFQGTERFVDRFVKNFMEYVYLQESQRL